MHISPQNRSNAETDSGYDQRCTKLDRIRRFEHTIEGITAVSGQGSCRIIMSKVRQMGATLRPATVASKYIAVL